MKEDTKERLEIGSIETLDPNTKFITIEGAKGNANNDLLWRVHGDVANPDCQIIVPPTHYCILIKDGQMQAPYGGGRYPIFETQGKGLFKKKVQPAFCDVIFINRTIKLNGHWGTKNPIYGRDPITDLPVTLRGFGEYEIGVSDPNKFYLEIAGLDTHFDLHSLQERMLTKLMAIVEPVFANSLRTLFYSYADIVEHKQEINQYLTPLVDEMFVKDTGLTVYSFTIDNLTIDENEIKAIEKAIAERKRELKEKETAEEIAEKLRQLDEQAWNRKLTLKQLESADNEKYLAVLSLLNGTQAKPASKPAASKGAFCSKCGNPYKPGEDLFCPKCGNKLVEEKHVCKNCGKELKEGALFCSSCGTPVK